MLWAEWSGGTGPGQCVSVMVVELSVRWMVVVMVMLAGRWMIVVVVLWAVVESQCLGWIRVVS